MVKTSVLYHRLCDMYVTVVGCLQNLLSSLEPPSWGGAPVITQIWERVFILIQSRGNLYKYSLCRVYHVCVCVDVTDYLMEPCTALLKVLTAVDKEHKLNLVRSVSAVLCSKVMFICPQVCGVGQLPFFCELMQKALLQSALSTCVNVARIIGSFGEKSEDQKQLQVFTFAHTSYPSSTPPIPHPRPLHADYCSIIQNFD